MRIVCFLMFCFGFTIAGIGQGVVKSEQMIQPDKKKAIVKTQTPESSIATVDEQEDVQLVCNTDGMSANQIELRKISKLNSEISILEKLAQPDVDKLVNYRKLKENKEASLMQSMNQLDFSALNVEEQMLFIELAKQRDADKAAQFYGYYKSGLSNQ